MGEQPNGHQGPFIEPSRGGAFRRLLASRGGMPGNRPRRGSPLRSVVGFLWRAFRWRLVLTALALVLVAVGTLAEDGSRDVSGVVPRMIDGLGDLGTTTTTSSSTSTTTGGSSATSTITFAAPDVAIAPGDGSPDSTVRAGSELVSVRRLSGRRVIVEDMLGRTYTWIVPTQAHRQLLRGEVGRFVLVTWTRQRAGVTVTAVRVTGQPTSSG